MIFPVPEDDLPDILPQFNAGTPVEDVRRRPRNVKMLATGRDGARQPDRHHHRHREGARAVRQFRLRPVPHQFVNAQLLVMTLHNVITVPTAVIERGVPGLYMSSMRRIIGAAIKTGLERDGR